jgi:hypothetical protein
MPDQTPQTPQGKLKERALKIAQWDLESLIHPKNGAPISFEGLKDLFQQIKSFYSEVASTNWELPPSSVAEGFVYKADSMINAMKRAQDFNVRSGDPNQASQSVINEVTMASIESYNHGAFHLAYARTSSAAISGEINALSAAAADSRKVISEDRQKFSDRWQELEKQMESRLEALRKSNEAAREAAKIEGVAGQARAFEEQASSDKKAARNWLYASAIAVALGLFLVWGMFLADPKGYVGGLFSVIKPGATDPEKTITALLIQQGIARVLIVTLIYAAVVWCARNYFASRHNYTVNRHRSNAMQTFRAFVAGSEDKATQDFILRQVAQCAFSPQQTGYLKDESLPTPGPAADIINIAKPI